MKFYRAADVPPQHGEPVFAYSRARAILGAALVAASACATLVFARLNGAWPGYIIGAILILMLLLFHKLVAARFHSSNWLLRATQEGIFVKFRSYLNDHFDDRDLTVIFLPYSEIRSATVVRQTRELPDRNEGKTATRSTRRMVTLDISSDCTPLSKLLANERERIFGKSAVGAGKISTRYQHLPVRLVNRKRLQIEWGVVPDAQAFLDILARHSIPQEASAVTLNLADLENLTRTEQEERLLELVEGGDKLGAIALARRLYAYDLTAAKKFIDELVRRQTISGA